MVKIIGGKETKTKTIKPLSHHLILNLKNTVSGDGQSMEFPAVQQNQPEIVGIIFSSSVTASAAATRETSLGEGGFSPCGVQSVNLAISDAFHFGAASNEGSISSSSSPLS